MVASSPTPVSRLRRKWTPTKYNPGITVLEARIENPAGSRLRRSPFRSRPGRSPRVRSRRKGSHFAISDPHRLSDNGINQRPAETEAARLRQHVQTLHLATPLGLYGSKANAPYRLSVPIAREKYFSHRRGVFTGQACQLSGKILIAQIDADRGCGRSVEIIHYN